MEKTTSFIFVLLIVGCCGFSIINTIASKSFIELQLEAEETCITNYSLYAKENRRLLKSSPSELVCPLQCLLSKLGLVNEGGLNKILVNWTRKMFDIEEKENIFGSTLQNLLMIHNQDSQGIQTDLDAIFHIIRRINNQIKESCSAKDTVTRNHQIMTSLNEIQIAIHSQPSENQAAYIPSEENSRYLELAQNAGQTCMTKYNVTMLSLIREFKLKTINRPNVCTVHCLYSELEFVNENGLNPIWVDEYRKIYKAFGKLNDFEALMEIPTRILPVLNSYCSSSNHQISESELKESIEKVLEEIKKLRNKPENEYE